MTVTTRTPSVPDLMGTTLDRLVSSAPRTGERIVSVLVLGHDLTVAVASHYDEHGAYVENTVTAFDADGNVLALLARTAGPVPDATLAQAYRTAAFTFHRHCNR